MPKKDTEVDPKDTLRILDDLSKLGFTDSEFRTLHHFGGSMSGFRAYCKNVQRFRAGGENQQLYQRLEKELDRRRKNNY